MEPVRFVVRLHTKYLANIDTSIEGPIDFEKLKQICKVIFNDNIMENNKQYGIKISDCTISIRFYDTKMKNFVDIDNKAQFIDILKGIKTVLTDKDEFINLEVAVMILDWSPVENNKIPKNNETNYRKSVISDTKSSRTLGSSHSKLKSMKSNNTSARGKKPEGLKQNIFNGMD